MKPHPLFLKGLGEIKRWMRENDRCGKVIYMSDVQGPEKVNDICMKTLHVGTMDRGFILMRRQVGE
jgi:hypothetical protein